MAEKIQLDLVDITPSSSSNGAYVMALTEIAGARSLAIVIGPAEAHSIVIVMEKMPITRPLTHDLFVSLAENFEIHVEEVFIYQMIDGIFYARIIVRGNGKTIEVDSRTSDAVAIAIRFGAPIFCAKEVMDEVGRDMRALTEGDELDFDLDITEDDLEEVLTPEEILKKLDEALLNEDYELASKLRDELEKRNKK
ncbi:MAG: bifunctional nuclease domain-containing protein [Sediminibacterium sp.]